MAALRIIQAHDRCGLKVSELMNLSVRQGILSDSELDVTQRSR